MERRWWIRAGAGAAVATVAGAFVAGAVLAGEAGWLDGARADGNDEEAFADVTLTPGEALEIAGGEGRGHWQSIEIDRRQGRLVFEVEYPGADVIVDAQSRDVVAVEPDGDDANDPELVLPEASMGVDEAIAAARDAAGGRIESVELERRGSDVVFVVESDDREAVVSPIDGTVLETVDDD